jgi:peptide chain release factor subunit 3
VETFKDYPELGRFTLRDEQKTVAVGRVLKVTYAEEDFEEVEEVN